MPKSIFQFLAKNHGPVSQAEIQDFYSMSVSKGQVLVNYYSN